MKEAYFIRHAHTNYFEGDLTSLGIIQRAALVITLEPLLPANASYALICSSSPRVIQTAEPFVELIRRKTGQKLDLITEGVLGENEAINNIPTLLANGTRNVALIDKYQKIDIPLFFSHKEIIAPTIVALANNRGMTLPEKLKLIEDKIDDPQLIDMVMKRHKCSREEVDDICKKHYGWNPWQDFPNIAKASAIHFNFTTKEIKYIRPVFA